MNILAAIKREEKKLEKQLGKLQHQLNSVRAAAKALGDTTNREVTIVKKRVLILRRESEDCGSRQEAVGEGKGAGQEGNGIAWILVQ